MMQPRRAAFSLLEVMLATTVLLGSVMVLSHIAFVGTAHMDAAEQYAAAQLVCQSRMNEMLAGALPIEEVSGQPIAELPGWGLTVKIESASQPGLLALEVTAAEQSTEAITQVTLEASAETTAETLSEMTATTLPQTTVASGQLADTGKRFTLVRWIAEPQGSALSNRVSTSETLSPLDLPVEPSLFDDSLLPDESLLPEEPMPPDGEFMPEEPPLPADPSMFDTPIPEL